MTAETIFYRILGNDIPPRHSIDQTLGNLEFILNYEPDFADCEKRFLLNRIVDASNRERILTMIDAAGLRWDEIDFDIDQYRRLDSLYEKGLYLTNQNAARNRCIELGLADAAVVLPFDGQAFFDADGWAQMVAATQADADLNYATVPMFRLSDSRLALQRWARRGVEDDTHIRTEPQILLRRGHDIRFNESLTYGQANKVEFLMRLGVRGPWDDWRGPLFDTIRSDMSRSRSQHYGRVPQAGYVFRLESGNRVADRDMHERARTRHDGLLELVAQMDAKAA